MYSIVTASVKLQSRVLRINSDGKIQEVVGFRQLTSGELEKHVKPEVQR